MNAAIVEWIPAETPHARVPGNGDIATPGPQAVSEIHAAIERIRKFEHEILCEAEDRPLIVVDRP
jgi:hypothetical protein